MVRFCVERGVASAVRAVDKTMVAIAHLSPEETAAFDSAAVSFVQADLSRDAHIERAFAPFPPPAADDADDEAGEVDVVINCAAETRHGLAPSVYDEKVRQLSVRCAARARRAGARFVEMSTAFVYKPQCKAGARENAALAPWTALAEAQARADAELLAMAAGAGGARGGAGEGGEGKEEEEQTAAAGGKEKSGGGGADAATGPLDLVILRPALVYGPADVHGLMPRIVCAAAYVELREKMKFLWNGKMRLNTVHVADVVAAAWAAATAPRAALPAPPVLNLADAGDTDQKDVNAALGRLFGIETGFHGKLLSNIARLRLGDVVDDANDKHMGPWVALCRRHEVSGGSPLSPYLHRELLGHNDLCVDGRAAAAALPGFTYRYGRGLDEAALRASVQRCIDLKLFPPILRPPSAE
eukprot:g3259.t1